MFTRIPLNNLLKGDVIRGRMPYDLNVEWSSQKYEQELKIEKVSCVILLAKERECERLSGVDLMEWYTKRNIEVIHCPIPDFHIPTPEELLDVVDTLYDRLIKGEKVLVHCHAGNGRTGIVIACLVKKIFKEEKIKLDPLEWLKLIIPRAANRPEQTRMVQEYPNFQAKGAKSI